MPEQNTDNTIFIGNVPYDAQEEELKRICQKIGPIRSIKMIKDSNTNLNKGIAFCEYLSPDVASRAIIELRGQELHGRTLRFDNADGKRLNDSDNKSSLVNFTDDEVYDFVCTCQDFASNNPEKMEEILSNNPSMVRGLLEAFDEMDVLSEKVQGMELHSRFN